VREFRKESWEREHDTYYVGNGPWLQAYPTSGEFALRFEKPEGDPQTEGEQQAVRVSQFEGKPC
jgi:hypothetical protein